MKKFLLFPLLPLAAAGLFSSCYEAPYPQTYEQKMESGRRLHEINQENNRYEAAQRRARGGNNQYHYWGNPSPNSGTPVY